VGVTILRALKTLLHDTQPAKTFSKAVLTLSGFLPAGQELLTLMSSYRAGCKYHYNRIIYLVEFSGVLTFPVYLNP